MVALRDARRLSWLLTTTTGAAVRFRTARRGEDGKTPSSPTEMTTLGTPSTFPTPKALFKGSPTHYKGLGNTYGGGEADETENTDDEKCDCKESMHPQKEIEDAEAAYRTSTTLWASASSANWQG